MERYVSSHKGYYCGGDSTYIAKALTAKTGWKSPENHKVPYVVKHGSLPRKTFSMGEAEEKRYYLECRKIV